MTAINPPATSVSPPVLRRERAARVKPHHWWLTAGLYLFFAVFLVWPIVNVVWQGFATADGQFTLEYVQLIFTNPVLVDGLVNATLIGLFTTALCVLIAMPLAMISTKFDFAGRSLFTGLLLVPLVLPPFVGAVGMRQIFGREGPLTQMARWLGINAPLGIDWLGEYRLLGIVVVEALHLYPIMLLNLQAALANMDPAMESAARNLGATRWTVFRKITLPLMRPGLFAGCTIVLIWSFTELGTPLIFDFYTVTPVQVFKQISQAANNPLPYALIVVMLAASTVLYLVGKVLLGRGFDAATTKAGTASTTRKLTGLPALLALSPFVLVFLVAVIPHVSVVLTAFSGVGSWYQSVLPNEFVTAHFGAALTDEKVSTAVTNSLLLASLATIVAIVVGLAVATIVVRSKVPGRGVIDALAMMPLAVPGIVLAFGYLAISLQFLRWFPEATAEGGWLYWLNVPEFPMVVLVLAYAARRLPYVARSAVAGLQQTPEDLELAASNLGASKSRVLARITVPLILANLIAGGLLAFAFAMLEVSDSLILAQREQYYPITKAIYSLSQRLGDGVYIASALGVWAMLLLTFTILAANALLAKKMGAIFRV
ncbi:MAG: ABC transporter permease [Phycisphaerae bacterium]